VYIQYVGVQNSASFRTYTFHVVDPPRESREFSVHVTSADFTPGRLKFQDGPEISSERLHRELKVETMELPARAELHVSAQDVWDYRTCHYPPPKPRDRKP